MKKLPEYFKGPFHGEGWEAALERISVIGRNLDQ